jgi:hypothetical protein
MKKTITLLLLLALCGLSFSKPVDEETAKLVGQNFLTSRATSASFKNGTSLELSYASTSKSSNPLANIKSTTYFYVFNVTNGDGYVIVSADDNTTPILGYSDEVDFNPNNIPINAQKWLESYKNEIRYIIQNNISSTNDLIKDWEQLVSGKVTNNSLGKKRAVSPLIQTKWDQSPYYNALCPYDNSANERTVSGCVATAMAQVMKFWNYPATGTGSHSYNHSKYGTLSANFGSTTYNWSSMPNQVTSSNSAVATLMYHCGVSVDMNYDIASNGGSGAYVITSGSPITHCSEYAFKNYFGYKSSLQGIKRSSYTQTQWILLLKTELDAGRPILHDGFGSGGGHAFVCDGYDNNNFFHFNWGWGGQEDGYFNVNALNPGSLGTGGGTGGFNSGQEVIIGIEPPVSTQTLDMRLYSAITVNPNPIEYGNGFSVTANFANYGANSTKNFTGDFAAAIFNSNNQFVSYIQIKTGYSLNFNSYFNNPIVFSTNNISALTPGNYTIGVYYKPTGTQQWIAFANGNYQNFKSIEVKGNDANPLKLYAAITTTPNIITRNQTFTVNFDVANFASSTFNGDISVDIHNSDGTWIRELSIKTGLSLPSNTHFTNGLTYTITGGIDDSAGTYQFFVWSKPSGGTWEFLGNGSFLNPINVQIKDPSLSPDIYESNNTQNTSFNLPISFSGNTVTKTTIGSNLHLGNDYDYYKIVLPSGFNYSIEGRLHDSYNSGNSQTYTVDGLLSYSTDGTTWSDAFDDIISNNILVNGGGTLYFMVSPYFTGSTGTYLLDAKITRSAVLSSEKEITALTTNGIVGQAIINSTNGTINLNVSNSTDVTSLSPIISVSNFASINPNSGTPRNFTNPVTYTVTAQDASTKQWTVTVTKLTTGLSNVTLSESINIYPNPTTEQLFIDLKNFKGIVNSISLIDIQGKEVFRNDNITNENLQLNNLNDGIYVVHIETELGAINRKVIVQK